MVGIALSYALFVTVIHQTNIVTAECGCKDLRECYIAMLDELLDRDEEACIENANPGTSTYIVFLSALAKYCSNFINVTKLGETVESRYLYEVVVNIPVADPEDEANKPIIMVDAGQRAGTEPVMFALYIIEQLVACEENKAMITKAKWVILPSTNPDGMEFNRHSPRKWTKNVRRDPASSSFGVDISRNFETYFDRCDPSHGMSPTFAGKTHGSENETIFIKQVYDKYSKQMKAYVSIRRDGHGLYYPYAYSNSTPGQLEMITKVANMITSKVNQKAGQVQVFMNDTIYNATGSPYCGHSVDLAYDGDIYLSYEMQVFMGSDSDTVSKFQTLPRGFESSLRQGYFSGIKELCRIVTEPDKFNLKL